jgi:hypothetical protein
MVLMNLNHQKKTKLAKDYFDQVTSKNLHNAVEQTFNVLVGMKENILQQQIGQEITRLYFQHIQQLYSH